MEKEHTVPLRHHIASTRRISVSAFFNLHTRICLALLCSVSMSAYADIITVMNTNDSGPDSLRQALVDAHDGDTINFAVTGTIVLTSGGFVIDKRVTISGPGPDRLSIDGNQTNFQCVFGVADSNTVTISGLTVTNGNCGMYSDHASLTVNNCVVTANKGHSSLGGVGINDARGPTAPVERRNDCDAREAYGERPAGFATLTIANCVISDNSGSGVENLSASVTIIDSTISGNFTDNSQGGFGEGGGIYTSGVKFPGNLTVINSTISGNFASFNGGGIASGLSGLTIVNSTISGNSTGDPDNGYGGGIAADGGGVVPPALTITNSTVGGNSSAICGGVCGGTVEIENTILNANASGNIDGTVTSHGYNISSDDGGGHLNGPGDQINTDPLLGPLRNHGGPTLTHMPRRGSPAIDAGDPNFSPPPDHDQRGACFLRVFGPRIDVGSVETQLRRRCVTPAPRPIPH
jgi:hypothetical protein